MQVTSWGRYPAVDADVLNARSVDDVAAAISSGPLIARGLGRSYGDSSLADRMLDLTSLDALLAFDEENGVLTCEAGASLNTLISVFLPRGWFLPVTPGTRFVTVGGAIASDVHGKNHHVDGSFADHVDLLTLMLADGSVVTASRAENPDLFHATCGGMGLTGIILSASIRMLRVQSALINEHIIKTPDLGATLAALDEHRSVTYSVAWIDLVATAPRLGRSLLILGEHATDGDLTAGPRDLVAPLPVDLPQVMLNRQTVKVFNAAYYRQIRGNEAHRIVPIEPYFYPLDKVGEWNRAYGKRGFVQHQSVIPFAGGPEVLREMVGRIADSGLASPLAVLKTMGEANDSMLGFPAPGYTLAVDLQVTRQAFELCDRLDRLVTDVGGRLYLTKDSRMSPETFRAGYPRLSEFEAVRKKYGATGVFVSAQSQRLELT